MDEKVFSLIGCPVSTGAKNLYKKAFDDFLKSVSGDASEHHLGLVKLKSRVDAISANVQAGLDFDATYEHYLERMRERVNARRTKGIAGIPTGYKTLDDCTGGWQEGLHFIGGWTSAGKTSFLVTTLLAAAKAGFRWRIYSCDIEGVDMLCRFASQMCNIALSKFPNGDITDEEEGMLAKTAAWLSSKGCLIDEKARTIESIVAASAASEKQFDMFIVDTLQSVQVNDGRMDQYERFCHSARLLKGLKKHMHKPIIITAQAKDPPKPRDEDETDVPTPPGKNSLEGAKRLSQEAKTVTMVYRSDYDNEKDYTKFNEPKVRGLIILAKNQTGRTQRIKANWFPKLCVYREADINE